MKDKTGRKLDPINSHSDYMEYMHRSRKINTKLFLVAIILCFINVSLWVYRSIV